MVLLYGYEPLNFWDAQIKQGITMNAWDELGLIGDYHEDMGLWWI